MKNLIATIMIAVLLVNQSALGQAVSQRFDDQASALAQSGDDIIGLSDFDSSPLISKPGFREKMATYFNGIVKDPGAFWDQLPKEDKVKIVNTGLISLIIFWGFVSWDYQPNLKIHFKNENWFEKDSKYGGADKLGHFFTTYVFAESMTSLYKSWGYEDDKAIKYAALSAWVVQGVMEVFDGTSPEHGFSYEDMIMNSLGALTSMLMQKYPYLDGLIDFRLQQEFNIKPKGIFDDYSNFTYLIAFKLAGIHQIRNKFLRLLEVHLAYNSRGYDTGEAEKSRNLYVGVSLNFSELMRTRKHPKAAKFLEYMQIPYTSLKIKSKDFNQ